MPTIKMNSNTRDELIAVKYFLISRGDNFDDKDIKKEENENTPVDVIYKDEKFQIKRIPSDGNAVLSILDKKNEAEQGSFKGRQTEYGKLISGGGNFFNIFIKEPITNLIKQYGKDNNSFKNIICLLYVKIGSDPYLKITQGQLNNFDDLKHTGFKEIYLVNHQSNMKIYPNREIKYINKKIK